MAKLDSETASNIRRAELARARLAHDLGSVLRAGGQLVQRGKSVLNKVVPVVLAIGILGLIVVAAAVSRRPARSAWRRPRRASPVREALRKAAVSAIGVLASRLAGRVPLPELASDRRSSAGLRRGDVEPMLPEPRAERERHPART